MDAQDRGMVTRSRSIAADDKAVPATPSPASVSNSGDTETNSPVQEVKSLQLTPERAVDSPVRMTRSRRSISTSSNPVESPSRNLRKRNLSPDAVKNSPAKPNTSAPMTPTRRLRKNENTLFSTVDSPKPRKTRQSLSESTGTNTESQNLRRSRRLSSELNVVQEDPIKEAVIDPVLNLPPSKGRRGKRLSVMPAQPSLPEETETSEIESLNNSSQSAIELKTELPLNIIDNEQNSDAVREKSSNSIFNNSNSFELRLCLPKIKDEPSENSLAKEEKDDIEQQNESVEGLRKSTTPKILTPRIAQGRFSAQTEQIFSPTYINDSNNQLAPNTSTRSNSGRKSTTPKISEESSEKLNEFDNQLTPNTSTRNNSSRKSATPKICEASSEKLYDPDNQFTPNTSTRRNSNRKSATPKISEASSDKSNDFINQLTPNNSSKSIANRKSATPEMSTDSPEKSYSSDNKLTPNIFTRSVSQRKSSTSTISEEIPKKINESDNQLTPNTSAKNIAYQKSATPKTSIDSLEKSFGSDSKSTPNISTRNVSFRKSGTPKISQESSEKSNDSDNKLTPNTSTRSFYNRKSATPKMSKESVENLSDAEKQLTPNNSIKSISNRKSVTPKIVMDSLEKSNDFDNELIPSPSVDIKANRHSTTPETLKMPSEKSSDNQLTLNTSAQKSTSPESSSIQNNSNGKSPASKMLEEASNNSNNQFSRNTPIKSNSSRKCAKDYFIDEKKSPDVNNSQESYIFNNSVLSAKKSSLSKSLNTSEKSPNMLLKSEKSLDNSSDSSDSDEKNKINSFLDSSASDAGMDYQSGDSMDENEKDEMDENEIIEKGETLHSDDSLDAMVSNDSYEKDSFLISSEEEDEVLLSGTGDDLSSGDELSQSRTSKEKYDTEQKKLQKRASREMFEARHSTDKIFDNSGKNNFKASSQPVSDDSKENRPKITNGSRSSLSPHQKIIKDNFDSDSSDGEALEIVKKTFDEELLRLQNNIMDPSSDSESEIEAVGDEIKLKSVKDKNQLFVNSTPKILNADDVSKMKTAIQESGNRPLKHKGLNKSDTIISTNKNLDPKLNKSAQALENPKATMEESMQRLMNLNQSLSKVFTSLVNDMDRLKDNVDLQVSNELSAIAKNTDLENEARFEIDEIHQSKRKLSQSDSDETKIKKPKKNIVSERLSTSDSMTAFEHYEKLKGGKTKSKRRRTAGNKLINKENKISAGPENLSKNNKSEPKPRSVRCVSSTEGAGLASTSQFRVQDLQESQRSPISCTGTAGKISAVKLARGDVLRNVSAESTTAFRVALLKDGPERAVRRAAAPFVDFKMETLYGKKIKRESSRDIVGKRQKLQASRRIKSGY